MPHTRHTIVSPFKIAFDEPLLLECGQTLPRYDLMVETYGTLNADKTNAILICHALSGSHHAAGYYEGDKKPGWWDALIGTGKAIDTDQFFVVCLNNIGSCYGATGPTSINPKTGNPYGSDFPLITIKDWVKTQKALMMRLDIPKWHAVVGGSMGGMQALQWAIDYPDDLSASVVIAAAPKLSAQNIAFNEVARQSILSDPDFCRGYYLKEGKTPKRGLVLARMVGHITYLTDKAMRQKFGRELKSGKLNYNFDVEFEVESYLRYQGERFSQRFDANTYLLMTKALDYFDPAAAHAQEGDSDQEALARALSRVKCRVLVISFSTDWRFSPERSREIVDALLSTKKDVSYLNIQADYGHDSFLFALAPYAAAVSAFLNTKEASNAH